MKAKMVLYHDDPPCIARLNNGRCTLCNLTPDMQSTCLYYHCPKCDVPLEGMSCPCCGEKFEKK